MGVVIANSMVVGRLNAGRLRPKQSGQISAPNQISAEQASQLQAARELDAINAPSIAAPNQINAIPDNTSPPFDMRHARILYDNVLSDASGSALVRSPNTYEKATGATFIFTMPESRAIDCICALGVFSGLTVSFRAAREGESFVTLGTVEAEDDKPIMFLFPERQAERVAVVLSSSSTMINVSAGIALQMQRPIFGGHNPITMSRQTEYQSRRSESGNFVSRNIIRKGLSGSYEWSNLTDDWVREYFDPFIESARKKPFFIAWRPDSYPDEVAYAWTTGDISPNNIGTRNLMSVGMDVQAYGD